MNYLTSTDLLIKKPAAQLKQQAFHQIKNTKEFRLILPAGVLYQGRTTLQFFL